MGPVIRFLLCSIVVFITPGAVELQSDRPFLRVQAGDSATLSCCYRITGEPVVLSWVRIFRQNNLIKSPENMTNIPQSKTATVNGITCGTVTLEQVQLKDTGMYRCHLNAGNVNYTTHGTYLQVYELFEKTFNVSEHTKNRILVAEGFLLLLCVLVPGITLLRQSRKVNKLEKKKMKKEEENIYQGLNLDDCCTTYDQIERSQGPYQDVCNIIEEEEEIQLEKP